MRTSTIASLHPVDAVRRKPWHLDDRRVRTRTAARHAAEIAERVSVLQAPSPDLDDVSLFSALHVAAYRAGREDPEAADGQATWLRRWNEIREYIVKKHMGLVYLILGRFNANDWDEDDRLSEAMYVLGRAVEHFNPWKGFRFSTYACNAIVRALMRRLRRERRYRKLFPLRIETLLERPVLEHDGHHELYAERLHLTFAGNLAGLTDLEATIIGQRFPRENQAPLTLQQISDGIGLSKERVRQLQNTALKKLRAALDADPVLR
jgi:RNA polymerase sigma factor (sigma-70 family)